MVEQTELNRLFWHSRRGMLELDVLLVPFTQEVYPTLSEADRELYRRLLTCEDRDMFGWFMERTESDDPELQRMVRIIPTVSSPSEHFECRWQGSRLLLAAYLTCQVLALWAMVLSAQPWWLSVPLVLLALPTPAGPSPSYLADPSRGHHWPAP